MPSAAFRPVNPASNALHELAVAWWIPGEIMIASADQIDYSAVSATNPPLDFFRAEQADVEAYVYPGSDVIQTNPVVGNPSQTGSFTVSIYPPQADPVTVYYRMSGTASNGVDYTDGNGDPLSGALVLPAFATYATLDILPVPGRTYLNPLSITFTINATNAYLISPDAYTATIRIFEPLFAPVALLYWPVGIDYHSPSNALVVSYDYDTGSPGVYDFAMLSAGVVSSNGVLVTNVVMNDWSQINSLPDEVKVGTVKQSVNGFTTGDLYFSSGYDVGWMSADSTSNNLNWCVLTNSEFSSGIGVRGGLYVDLTGTWSNELIVAASDAAYNPDDKPVWRVDAQGSPTLVTSINTLHLEGVITLTNDVNQWGPWAGKIITGDEQLHEIYAVDTDGVTTSFDLGIDPEDFDIIPTNQNLYACVPAYPNGNSPGAILKLPASYFTNHVGDLLITQAGEFYPFDSAKLFIVHWDSVTTNFVIESISYTNPDGSSGGFEHVTFAPIELPYLSE